MKIYILQGFDYEDSIIDGVYKNKEDAKRRKKHLEKLPNYYTLSEKYNYDKAWKIVESKAKELNVPESYAGYKWMIIEEELK